MTAFPIRPKPDNDPRFTFGLFSDIRDVLSEHGYDISEFDGRDLVNLQQAMFRFLYSED
jgi:hypothetical protein